MVQDIGNTPIKIFIIIDEISQRRVSSMPWEEKSIMDLRLEFVQRALTENIPFSELCKEYNISRKTGYKWKQRFLEYGYNGLANQSTRPESSPNQLSEDTVIRILQIKQAHPNWGARKIQKIFEKSYPLDDVPSESSIKRILDKAGLVKKTRVSRVNPSQDSLRQGIQPEKSNDVWTIDFKGWWYSTDNLRCLPLTIRDEKSRFILDIRLMKNQSAQAVKEVIEHCFKEYGLPNVIRSDNGAPFAAHNSPLGLTSLSAWWMSLGIIPDRIDPGCPFQNGGHERMHRDLKMEVQGQYKANLSFFQSIIDEWRIEFNNVRPHEALNYQTPAEAYTPSPVKYKGDVDELIYPFNFLRRKVSKSGKIKINNTEIFITNALAGYHLGLEMNEENRLNVWFNKFLIGEVDLQSYSFYTIQNRI